jgi:hypothetical protein
MKTSVIYIALIVQANPAGGLYNEASSDFLAKFGFPIFVSVGLFALFGSLMWAMTSRFFKNMEASNVERREITTQFTGVLENALQSNTQQLTLANESLRQTCETIATLDGNSAVQHNELTAKIDACATRLKGLEVEAKRGHDLFKSFTEKDT